MDREKNNSKATSQTSQKRINFTITYLDLGILAHLKIKD